MFRKNKRNIAFAIAILLLLSVGIDVVTLATEETESFSEEQSEKEVVHENELNSENESQIIFFEEDVINSFVGERIDIVVKSEILINEFELSIPKEAIIMEDAFTNSGSYEQITSSIWKFNFIEASTYFQIPLVINKEGNHKVISESEQELDIVVSAIESEVNVDKDKEIECDKIEEVNKINAENINEHLRLTESVFDNFDIQDEQKQIVTSENILEHFLLTGASYNHENGVITLTEDIRNQAGSMTLNQQMMADFPVLIRGSINLGARVSNGGDGIGLGFHTSDPSSIGQTGQGMGLAGLENVFGFKWDTYYNSSASGLAASDPSRFRGQSFSGFVYSNPSNGLLTTYDHNESLPRKIADPNNTFKDFSVVYNPGPNTKIISVMYDGQVWHTDANKWISQSNIEYFSFLISAATGDATNLQQIKIDRMEYITTGRIYDLIRVDSSNFLEHFDLQGATYNANLNRVTLTEDRPNLAGSINLKTKLSNTRPLSMRGRVNLGSKGPGSNNNRHGADGLAFGFHNSPLDSVGGTGNGMGIAGLNSAFGFKLDTNINTSRELLTEADPSRFQGGVFSSDVPFGSFIFTNNYGRIESFDGDEGSARQISTPNGTFRTFSLHYNPGENSRILTINYNGDTWHKDVTEWQPADVTALTFLISASTGARSNLHQIEIDEMYYEVGKGEVDVKYIDIASGKEILPTKRLDGTIGSMIEVESKISNNDEPFEMGYDFVEVDAPEGFDISNPVVELTEERKTITFYFEKAVGNYEVNYLDTNGIQLSGKKTHESYVNENFEIEVKEIEGHSFLKEKDNKELQGTVSREYQEFTLIYKNDKTIVLPVDPLNPDQEVNPENPPTLPEDQGLFSLDFASKFDFDLQAISAQDQTYYAKPQRLLNEDGTVKEDDVRPNYVQVSDRRSAQERDGWELSVRQNEQFHTAAGQELTGARLVLQNQQIATAQGGIEPGLQHTNPMTLIPGGAKRTLLKAQGPEGEGTWIYRFGNAESADQSVALEVPKGATPTADHYKTILTWELSSVPKN